MKLCIAHTTVDNGGVDENKWVIKLPENCEVDIESGTITIQGGEPDTGKTDMENTQMSSMSEEQLERFGQFMVDLFGLQTVGGTITHEVIEPMRENGWAMGQEAPKTLVGLGRIVVRLLSNAVEADNQILGYVRLDTPNNHVAKALLLQAIVELKARREPAEEYVEKRYEGHTDKFRADKLVQIQEKLRLLEDAGIEV